MKNPKGDKDADSEQEQHVDRRPVLRLSEQVRRRWNKRAEHILRKPDDLALCAPHGSTGSTELGGL